MTALVSTASPATSHDAPFLRDLDPTAREAIAAAGRSFELVAGDLVYREGDASESLFFVVSGAVSLRVVRRGETATCVLRTARRGDTFGEEATLPGVCRRSTASADETTSIFEVPIAVLRRAVERSGGQAAERERRYLRRGAVGDLVRTSALGRQLPEVDVEAILDAARLDPFARGERIVSAGDASSDVFLLLDGLVQLQAEDAGTISVRAYLSRGDMFGDEEALAGSPRGTSAVAMGDTWCARVPVAVVRKVSDRHPGLLQSLRRISHARDDVQARILGDAEARSTRHVFRDLYRMQMARALLVIDQDSCVRCGHCAWSCEQVHGVSRLVRRGDKVVTQLAVAGATEAASLLLPNTCQHCRNAACMIDCPTGAIGRDLGGEVFIREDLCTGCGNCAKACPWHNIQIGPRPAPVGPGLSAEVAVKCDLCRGFEAPACVQACPTESILRLDPSRDIAEVSHLLRGAVTGDTATQPTRRSVRSLGGSLAWICGAAAAASALGAIGLAMRAAGRWEASSGAGLAFGIAAGLSILALVGYAIPKRFVKLWMKRRSKGMRSEQAAPPRSRTRHHMIAHVGLGLVAAACALSHAGSSVPASFGGALSIAFWATAMLGAAGGLIYWITPSRLSRIERRGLLPEDFPAERRSLEDRLYRETTGRSDLLKTIAGRLIIPYARSVLGPLALIAGGHSLSGEQARLRARIDAVLDGRGGDRLAGIDDLIRTAVELRALPARRVMSALLRAWLPAHIVATVATLGLLAGHVVIEVMW